MNRPMIRVHDCLTDEVIDREMNDTEFALYEEQEAANLAIETETTEKAVARAALLERLNITEEEVKLLLS